MLPFERGVGENDCVCVCVCWGAVVAEGLHGASFVRRFAWLVVMLLGGGRGERGANHSTGRSRVRNVV